MGNVLITGGEQGLGLEIVAKMCARGNRIHNITGEDLKIPFEQKQFIDQFISELPAIDIVINNFGINHLSWIGFTPTQDEEIMRINVMAPYWIINALANRGDVCRVVNIASIAGRIPQRCTSLYCASKAALIMMTKVMARELAPKGWIINSFSPGKIEDTRMTELTDAQVNELRGWKQEEADYYALGMVPAGRYTNTEECAEAILGLLQMPSHVNGINLEMAGAV